MADGTQRPRRGWLIVEQDPNTYRAILYGLESDETLIVAGIGMVLRTETEPRGASLFTQAELRHASKTRALLLSGPKLRGYLRIARFFERLRGRRTPKHPLFTYAEAMQHPTIRRPMRELSPEDIVALQELAALIQ